MKKMQWLIILFILPIIVLNASDLDKLTRYNSKHYTFYTQLDNEWNKNLGKMMDAYFEYLCRSFQLKDDGRVSRVVVFTDRNAFVEYEKKETGRTVDNLAGYFYPSSVQPELVIHFDGRDFGTFFHEGLHQILCRLFPSIIYWPSWINEGMASYMEYTQYTNNVITFPEQSTWYYRNAVLAIKKTGKIKLDEFLKVSHAGWNRSGYDYALGAVLFDFLLNTKNPKYKNLIKEFMATLQNSQSYETAYSRTFGKVDLTELTKEFLKFMD